MPDAGTYDGDTVSLPYGQQYTTITGFNHFLVEKRFQASAPYLISKIREDKNLSVLELGPADGGMSAMIRSVAPADSLVVWDGTAGELLRASDKKYDVVYAMHIVEHVPRPLDFVRQVGRLVKEDGFAFISAPNANSLHRHLGTQVGAINHIYELGPRDLAAGHKRVYDDYEFRKLLWRAGFSPESIKLPCFIKPFPDRQMEKMSGRQLRDLTTLAQAPGMAFHDSQLLYKAVH